MKHITHGRPGVVTVGIGCAPGSIRPDHYIGIVTDLLSLPKSGIPDQQAFGDWIWKFTNVIEEQFLDKNDEIVSSLKDLYSKGKIRWYELSWQTSIQYYLSRKISLETLGLSNLGIDTVYDMLSAEDKKKFENDYEFAKKVIDEIFEDYSNKVASKRKNAMLFEEGHEK